jgi:hypothetical protein
MAELPSGTVTFLFSDIEGSTRLLKMLGDSYRDVLRDIDGSTQLLHKLGPRPTRRHTAGIDA